MTFNSSNITADNIFAETFDGEPVVIDFSKAVSKHILITAMTGAGKSVTARKFMELGAAAGMALVIFDAEGTFASLRSAVPNGLVVAGGKYRDEGVTIARVLKVLPELFASRASIVIDTSTLDGAEQAGIIEKFLSAMMKLPKELHHPCLVMIDEVQNFAPVRGSTKATAAIVYMGKEGRKRGFSLLVASQRIADVSRSLTSQTSIRMFGRLSEAGDRDRARRELGLSNAEATRLGNLLPGQFLIDGPSFSTGARSHVLICKPSSAVLGNEHLVAKLKLVPAPIEQLLALIGSAQSTATGAAPAVSSRTARECFREQAEEAADGPFSNAGLLDETILKVIKQFGPRGAELDSLALLVGSTERRRKFQDAISRLIASGAVAYGKGEKIKSTAKGSPPSDLVHNKSGIGERLAVVRAQREKADERVVACLSATPKGELDIETIRSLTGLGPRQLTAAIKRLRGDGWLMVRRSSIALSRGFFRLISK
ncbi:MAG: ATP-binding protein [Aliihoeflea sp.]|uniref:ATP-binding protein n=1 Tax=Aliihoeflea sp. TaxID=2608088 RepID=UPI004033C6E8